VDPQLISTPQSDYNLETLATKDGTLEVLPLLDLNLSDDYIIKNLHNTIQNSYDYWNDTSNFNLKNKRLKNLQMLEGKHLQEHKLYRHQTPYIDNELYVGVDAIIAYVTAQTPKAEVYPYDKSDEARILASNLEAYEYAHSENFKLPVKLGGAVYNMFCKYVGVIKLRWDPLFGENGEIVPEVVDPEHLILDKNTKLGENPRFVCHVLKDTVEGLISKFPEKEEAILNSLRIQRKGARNMTAEVAYREVWFSYFDSKNEPQEAVCWYMNHLVLDKKKNINWLYEGEGENFLDRPPKPFVFFNIPTDGSHLVDKTNAVEQAIPQQDILNKLGRQINDNLATANGFKVFDSKAMTKDDVQNATGDPNQSYVIKVAPGKGVKDMIGQFDPQLVSEQLITYEQEVRQTIHGILGTPSQFRGDDQDLAKTASTNMEVKNQASGRQDKIVRAIDYGADDYFKLLTQMITVWYTKKHLITVNGGDGNFDFIEMHQNKVKKGMTVRVQSGTTLPFDKARQEAVAQNAAELGVLSPYDYYRMMHMENPQKLYDNFIKFKTNPAQLAMDVLNNDSDSDAIVDFTELMGGNKVEQRQDTTPEYIEQFRKMMISDEFLKAKKSVQNKVLAFVQKAQESLDLRTELEQMSTMQPATGAPGQPPAGPPGSTPGPGQPGALAPAGQALQKPEDAMLQPQGSPIQAIMNGQPPQGQGPALNPQQPQVNMNNIGQLPPI
jgi:hypothetical protein